MLTKKILITGFGVDVTEQDIRALFDSFGPVERIDILREGNPKEPVALLEMSLSDGALAHLLARMSHYWHDGALINAHLLLH